MPKASKRRRDAKNKVIVVGLPNGFDSSKLEEMCEPFGKIYGCHVVGYDEASGQSRGYGTLSGVGRSGAMG